MNIVGANVGPTSATQTFLIQPNGKAKKGGREGGREGGKAARSFERARPLREDRSKVPLTKVELNAGEDRVVNFLDLVKYVEGL